MLRFENIIFLWSLAVIPLLVLIFFLLMLNKKRRLEKLGDFSLILNMIPDVSLGRQIVKFVLYSSALLFMLLTLANLQTGSKMQEVKRSGADIMLCLDVSNSMMAEDLKPNRLERAKQAIEKMIDKLEGDRIGMIVFAGEAYVQLPITTDYSAAKLFLNAVAPNMIPKQGTAIGAAIEKAMESFGKDEGKNKAIIIITDGENHEDDAVKLAEDAAKNEISIHTIGIGSDAGVPIPIYQNGVPAGYKKDREGNTVITKLNDKLLQEIAGAANGVYVKASNADVGLNAVLDKIAELDKKEIESKRYTDYEDQFQWFAGATLLFLLIEFFISERANAWLRKLNSFSKQ
ncbi:MAG TPA: VWA domain-containing protein [Bacteroidia bacterium]|jgi:Ca-activated chloride channel family protein|nr:VWA domain-containing protein [Bacteroidia bacterium]